MLPPAGFPRLRNLSFYFRLAERRASPEKLFAAILHRNYLL
ncbi:hypothetical protein HMPREF3038_00313 [Akkermansia sp. KLE1797]|nr:hypothetical protein HMPREF3038_00313 [Akkermansia sp. KLE1797]